jgi:hypothetical protein
LRVNEALQFLQQSLSPAEAARRLAQAHDISERQAHRYIRFVRANPAPVSIPEEKAVFTVKLPRSLIRRVRRTARQRGGAISVWVAEALQRALPADSTRG